jgi:hypothetical protein
MKAAKPFAVCPKRHQWTQVSFLSGMSGTNRMRERFCSRFIKRSQAKRHNCSAGRAALFALPGHVFILSFVKNGSIFLTETLHETRCGVFLPQRSIKKFSSF